jgi:DNA-binding transcriptional LysR family regulator
VAAPPGHPISGLGAVDVADVADATWVGVPVGWPFDSALSAWFAAAGRTPRVHRRFTDLRLQQALVAGGHGLALLPRRAAWQDDDRRRLVLRPVAGRAPARRIAALTRADRAERVAVGAVLRALVAEAATVEGWVAAG